MRTDLTELLMILDMSGSMYSLRDDTIGGYSAIVTTVLFNDGYSVVHDRVDINDVEPMTNADYVPQGTTAMLDAVGKAITSIGQKLAEMP